MIKSYKVRLFPTKEQEELLWKHINACRFIWNFMLEKCEQIYEDNETGIGKYEMTLFSKIIRKYDNMSWLNEVSAHSLNTVCADLENAYSMFFKGQHNHPKYKSKKKSKKSFPVRGESQRFYFRDDFVKIEKVGKVKCSINRKGINCTKFHNPRIEYKNNKWILSFGVECENQAFDLTDKVLGIDLGVKELAVCSLDGEKLVFHNINKSKRMRNLESKLKHIQRVIQRKYRTNGNYEKTNGIIKYENMMRKIYYKISCIRENYIHQTTHTLVSYLPRRVVMENLKTNNLMKNRHLSKAIQEQCFYKFIYQMKYKCEWVGIEFVQVNTFYPSSKTCSCCGHIKKDLKLSDRIYKCDECGLEIDRDFNAAINLMNYEV